MKNKITCLALFFLFLSSALSFPVNSRAESVIIFKGSTLIEDTLNGMLTIPYMEIQVASWGIAYSNDDLLIYEPSMRTISLYEDSLLPNLPDSDELITLTDGTTAILMDILDSEFFVIFDTDIGIATVDVLDHFAGTIPILPTGGNDSEDGDTTPPNTTIISGPSGIVSENDVLFTYTGSDNVTSSTNLVYSCRLDVYDINWSTYTYSTSKSYNDLPNGSYTFQVRAKDQAGQVDLTPASRSFVVNYTAPDSDSDGLPDDIENASCTDPYDSDTDNDGIRDGIEDFNRNGIVDSGETDPCLIDTDGDGIQDGTELGYTLHNIGPDTDTGIFQPDDDPGSSTNPLNADTDGDGQLDGEEDTNHNGQVDIGETDPNLGERGKPMPWLPLLLLDD